MPELTRAELKAQINELEEMLTACEVERDALKDELLASKGETIDVMRQRDEYRVWHIQSLTKQESE